MTESYKRSCETEGAKKAKRKFYELMIDITNKEFDMINKEKSAVTTDGVEPLKHLLIAALVLYPIKQASLIKEE